MSGNLQSLRGAIGSFKGRRTKILCHLGYGQLLLNDRTRRWDWEELSIKFRDHQSRGRWQRSLHKQVAQNMAQTSWMSK